MNFKETLAEKTVHAEDVLTKYLPSCPSCRIPQALQERCRRGMLLPHI